MSEKEKSDSAPEQQTTGSLFDFLYNDSMRIGSFLSQFNNLGHMQQIKETDEDKGYSARKGTITGVYGVPAIAGGSASLETSSLKEGRSGIEKTFDPLWVNALSFLSILDEKRIIYHGLNSGARIGQFVLVSGSMHIIDMELMVKLIGVNGLRELISKEMDEDASRDLSMLPHENRGQRRTQKQGQKTSNKPSQGEKTANLIFDILGTIPHPTQVSIRDDSGNYAWSSLKSDFLTLSPSDIALKHGPNIPGKWNLLGVVDAMPSELCQNVGNPDNPFHVVYDNFAPIFRGLGRPESYFGLTPILIFRKISEN